ncbi:MAG: pseudouridine-5'-phosphate glycosidase [Deltaproteobacteria bacterium]|nr:pseudouridine-5'-phosphate glycosidase [Deltaproteobacteria bacterium]
MTSLRIADEVRDAIAARRPVVALESTILSHGLPRPDNLAVGRRLESIVRAGGAVPATVAVIDGALVVGASDDEIVRLASEPDVVKVSRRDLPIVIARRALGATTVSATMIGAARAGIAVFATGGIGGVHRGFETSLDVSADLAELGRENVCVVCAGAKSILDLPRTMEVLETLGVPVLGWQTRELPAFFARESGLSLDHRVEGAAEVATILRAKWSLGLAGGVLVAVPPPIVSALPSLEIDALVTAAVEEAHQRGIRGKELTPYLLTRLREATEGRSLVANVALVSENTRIATQIACALSG